jgi:hypothetical protein
MSLSPVLSVPGLRRKLENRPSVFDDTVNHGLGGFAYDDLLTVRQKNDGIGRDFQMRDSFRVQHERTTIQTGEPNHTGVPWFLCTPPSDSRWHTITFSAEEAAAREN